MDNKTRDAIQSAIREVTNEVKTHVSEEFRKQDAKMEERFRQQDAKMEERFRQQDAKMESELKEVRAELNLVRADVAELKGAKIERGRIGDWAQKLAILGVALFALLHSMWSGCQPSTERTPTAQVQTQDSE